MMSVRMIQAVLAGSGQGPLPPAPIYDVTGIASPHATLSATLASICLGLLGVLVVMSQPHPDADGGRGGGSPRGRTALRGLPTGTLRLLVMAFFLLVLASVMWGGLAGQPGQQEQRDYLAATPSTQRLGAEDLVRSIGVEEWVKASGCTLLLALGALCLIAGVLELASRASDRSATATRFMRHAFGLLAALAVYEVVYFVMVPTLVVAADPHRTETAWAAGAALLTAVAALPSYQARWLRRSIVGIGILLARATRAADTDSLQVRLAVIGAVAATVECVFVATSNLHSAPSPVAWAADFSLGVGCFGAVMLILFGVFTSWTMAHDVPLVRRPQRGPRRRRPGERRAGWFRTGRLGSDG